MQTCTLFPYNGAMADRSTKRLRLSNSAIMRSHPEEVARILRAIARVTRLASFCNAQVESDTKIGDFGIEGKEVREVSGILGLIVLADETFADVAERVKELDKAS